MSFRRAFAGCALAFAVAVLSACAGEEAEMDLEEIPEENIPPAGATAPLAGDTMGVDTLVGDTLLGDTVGAVP